MEGARRPPWGWVCGRWTAPHWPLRGCDLIPHAFRHALVGCRPPNRRNRGLFSSRESFKDAIGAVLAANDNAPASALEDSFLGSVLQATRGGRCSPASAASQSRAAACPQISSGPTFSFRAALYLSHLQTVLTDTWLPHGRLTTPISSGWWSQAHRPPPPPASQCLLGARRHRTGRRLQGCCR